MATKLLHIDSSILGEASISRTLSAAVVERLKTTTSDLEITYRDLAAHPVPHLSGAFLGALQGAEGEPDPALRHDLAMSGALMEEFLAADIVVLGVAFYNFTVSSQLKAWIDRILVAGKTFRYTEAGPEGLAGDKRVILAIARGGFYGPGAAAESAEHGESYLRAALRFIGINDPQVIVAEGVRIGPDVREAAVKAALDQIAQLPAAA